MNSRARSSEVRQSRGWAFGFLLFACVALRVVGLFRPCLSDDEATYCVVAREMLSGRTLYHEVVDHKPPLIYFTYAATQALGGPTGGMRLLHLLTALVVFSTALLIGPAAAALRLTKRTGTAIGVAAAVGVVATWLGILLAYDTASWSSQGQGWPVSFCIVAVVFAFYLAVSLSTRRRSSPTTTQASVSADLTR